MFSLILQTPLLRPKQIQIKILLTLDEKMVEINVDDVVSG